MSAGRVMLDWMGGDRRVELLDRLRQSSRQGGVLWRGLRGQRQAGALGRQLLTFAIGRPLQQHYLLESQSHSPSRRVRNTPNGTHKLPQLHQKS